MERKSAKINGCEFRSRNGRFETENGMKSCVFTLMLMASLSLLACGGGHATFVSPITPPTNVWTWVNGANVVNQQGTYGSQGMPASGNVPGARDNAVSWTDASGNFWLFGGIGPASAMSDTLFNDLWEYSAGPMDVGGRLKHFEPNRDVRLTGNGRSR